MIGNNTIGFLLIVLGTPVITLVVMILVYSSFRKTFQNSKGGGWWALLPTVVLTPVIGFGVLFATVMVALWHPDLDFDRERWLAKPERRFWMTEKLIDSGMLLGQTRREAEQTLGPEWFYPEDHTHYGDAPGTYRVDTTRMVWYTGRSPGGLMVVPPNALEIRLEQGMVAEVYESDHSMPDDPIVRMSGFVVDPALDSLAFTERDRIKPWRGTSGGYARITRYYENGGDRQYLFLIPPRPHGVDSRQWAGQLAEMRDTPIIMDHRYDRIDLLYPVPAKDEEAIVWLDDHRHTDEIHFTFDHHAGCQIVITTDTLSPLSPRARATVAIEGGVRIYDVQTERYQAFIPDSVSLTFNHVPGGGGPLTGRFHARQKEFGRMGSDENDRLWDVVMEGAFRITLPDNYENP